ncbi:MAG: homoserine kinase [Methanobrevibacter sp. CfCl-M3]
MKIIVPSRLHMTLIDLNGSYGRFDGGIGLALANPKIVLKGELSETGISLDFSSRIDDNIKDEAHLKLLKAVDDLMKHFSVESGFHFTLEEAYPTHSGLGSGTQFALATGRIVCELLKDDLNIEYNDFNQNNEYNNKNNSINANNAKSSINSYSLGKILKRGGTSGIGTFSFDYGGFILDGGHSLNDKEKFLPSSVSSAKPPVLIGNYDFPQEWDVIVAIPNGDNKVSGKKEVDLFQKYCPVPKDEVEKLSHLILMNLIPFLLEKDIESFGQVINQIQDLGFKRIEVNLQPDNVKKTMGVMREFGAYGVGMSSFGPAIYGITYKNTKEVYNATKEYLHEDSTVLITKAQNYGHVLEK